MRDPAVFHEALRRLAEGQNAHEVAIALDVPWGTVRYWRRGKRNQVRSAREPGSLRPPCEPGKCSWMPPRDEAAYVYLLGAYLGDGAIQKVRRTTQLRIF